MKLIRCNVGISPCSDRDTRSIVIVVMGYPHPRQRPSPQEIWPSYGLIKGRIVLRRHKTLEGGLYLGFILVASPSSSSSEFVLGNSSNRVGSEFPEQTNFLAREKNTAKYQVPKIPKICGNPQRTNHPIYNKLNT